MLKQNNYLKKFIEFVPALIWMVLIFYLSSIPNLKTDLETVYDMVLRKGAHMFEYFVLTLLLWYALRQFRMWQLTKFNLIFIVSFLYALSDEWHQSFVAARSGNIFDVGIDTIGIVIGLVVIKFMQNRKR